MISLSIGLTIIGLCFEAASFFIAIREHLFLSKKYRNYLQSEKESKDERKGGTVIYTITENEVEKVETEAKIVVTFFVVGCFLQGVALFC